MMNNTKGVKMQNNKTLKFSVESWLNYISRKNKFHPVQISLSTS